jgi:tRNA threonylcarbamoyladenosine biosynthesis protein TsaE
MKKQIVVKNEIALIKVVDELFNDFKGSLGKQGIVLALEGPLGAGKTTFTKHLGKLLGVKEIIISPTFVLNTEYKIPARIVTQSVAGGPDTDIFLQHIDCWRLDSFAELENLGLHNIIETKAVIVLEWADKFKSQVSNLKSQVKLICVKIDYCNDDSKERIIEIS